MTPDIQSATRAFRDAIIGGVPLLIDKPETAFLSFMCMAAAIDALAAYRYAGDDVGQRYRDFVQGYFPPTYAPHAGNLYLFRCRVLHNFSPAYFSLAHAQAALHLTQSSIGDYFLSDDSLYSDLKGAAEQYFSELSGSVALQSIMQSRLLHPLKGGGIYYV